MYFLTSFMVLLRQLRRLYTSSSIFQVPPVYNYSTCCTNRVPTRFDTPSTRLRVRFAYASGTLLKHQLRGEVRQYIDHVAHLNIIDSHHRLKEHTILYIFRAPRHDSLVLLNQYETNSNLSKYLIKNLTDFKPLIKRIRNDIVLLITIIRADLNKLKTYVIVAVKLTSKLNTLLIAL